MLVSSLHVFFFLSKLLYRVYLCLSQDIGKISRSQGKACFCYNENKCNGADITVSAGLSLVACLLGTLLFVVH